MIRNGWIGLLLFSRIALGAGPVESGPLSRDLWLAAGLGASLLGIHSISEPAQCRWCDRDPSGKDQLNALDDTMRNTLKWDNSDSAANLSNLTAYLLAPVASFGYLAKVSDTTDTLGRDSLWVAQSVLVAMTLTQAFKLSVARERPYAHFGPDSQRASLSAESRVSFLSGHSSFTFSLAASAATVAEMRGYSGSGWIWGIGLGAAAATAYLRIAADRHYFTDVVAGAALGTLSGVLIPRLLHRETDSPAIGLSTGEGRPMILVRMSW